MAKSKIEDYKNAVKIISNEIQKRGMSIDKLEQILSLAKSLIEDIPGEKDYALELSKYVKQVSQKYHLATLDDSYGKMYWQSLLFESPYLFDSYLLYLEKNRQEEEKFYHPKMKQLNKHGLIQAMQDLEDDKLDLLTISMPPGTQKTTLEKFFCSWIAGKYPKDYSLFFSHSGDITDMFYRGVLDIITNHDEYTWQEIFPDVKFHSSNAKTGSINLDRYKPFANIQTSSVGASNAGKVRCNRYLYCDDLISGIEIALNKNRLDKLWSTYTVDARQRKLNQQVKEIHIATRWSVHDVIGRLQVAYAGSERTRFICVPDIDPVTGESNFDYEFNGMSVDFFNDQAKLMDEISYKCLYKNEPVEREGLLYHEEELRRYNSLPSREPDAMFAVCDTKDKGTDFMFMPIMAQYDNDFYLVDCVCDDNADYEVQYESCADMLVKYKVIECDFEHNNGGGRVGAEVEKRVKAKGWNHCNIISHHTSENKETKIIVNAPWVKKHVLFKDKEMYNPKSHYGVMMSWLLSYSQMGKNPHDDIPDGLAQFSKFIENKYMRRDTMIVRSPF